MLSSSSSLSAGESDSQSKQQEKQRAGPVKRSCSFSKYDDPDSRYWFDSEELSRLRDKAPWKDDPKWFQSVAISPSAIMKMMTHCQSGVEKGVRKGGNPVEVMGLLLGRPDPKTPRTLVVTDVFPLPIEGFETRVIADDVDVVNHMIALGESLEETRREKFMGWYHSHPFDVGVHSHCFLSQTDLSTQLQWQRAEDPHGNPFLAIVVDPLRSLARNEPQIRAFRAFPPEYQPPTANQCPDGSIVVDEQSRLEQWGSCWSRYYQLEVEYFMSRSARRVLELLNKNFLWMHTLASTKMHEQEAIEAYPHQLSQVANQLSNAVSLDISLDTSPATHLFHETIHPSAMAQPTPNRTSTAEPSSEQEREITKACQGIIDLATDRLNANITQVAKKQIFNTHH